MKEVSVRALEIQFRAAKKQGIPPRVLIEGTGYDLAHYQNKHERIEWTAFCKFMSNCSKVWTDDDMIGIGGDFATSPVLRSPAWSCAAPTSAAPASTTPT